MKNIYESAMTEALIGFAHCSLIKAAKGKFIDFRFVTANSAFEKIVKKKKEYIIGKKGTVIMPFIFDVKFDWLQLIADIAVKGRSIITEELMETYGRFYKTNFLALNDFEFTILLLDVTTENKQTMNLNNMIHITEDFLQFSGSEINYQKIVDDFLGLCNAKAAVFNLFNADRKTFVTKAISVKSVILKKVVGVLGFKLEGKNWDFDPVYFKKISQTNPTYFENLYDIIGDVMPKPIIAAVETLSNIGEVVVMKILHHDVILGEFTIFMDKYTHFNVEALAEIYIKQVGLLLTRYETEKELNQDQIFFETTLMSIGDGVISTNKKNEIVLLNKVAQQLTGWSNEEAIGKKISEVFNTSEVTEQKKSGYNFADVKVDTKEIEGTNYSLLVSKTGVERLVECTTAPIIDAGKQLIGFVLIFRDYTERNIKLEEIEYLSFRDQLTGLYNRRFYEEELMRIDQQRNLPISVIMGDVNSLKLINDTFGHSVGDELLIKTANILKKANRAEDVIARLGGDEFIVILTKTSSATAREVIERISQLALNESTEGITLSISLGYGTKVDPKTVIQDVVLMAEDAMYRQKFNKKDTIRSTSIELIVNAMIEKNKNGIVNTERMNMIYEKMVKEIDLAK